MDITSLVHDCGGMVTLRQILEQRDKHTAIGGNPDISNVTPKDALEELSLTLNMQELEQMVSLQRWRNCQPEWRLGDNDRKKGPPRAVAASILAVDLCEGTSLPVPSPPLGFYQNVSLSRKCVSLLFRCINSACKYVLVRPHPSLRILFASPELQATGVLQTSITSRIGGSTRVRDHLAYALKVGRKVTAKVQWLSEADSEGRLCWIHCTPLLGANDAVGVWVIILVNAEHGTSQGNEPIVIPEDSGFQLGRSYHAAVTPWDTGRHVMEVVKARLGSGDDNKRGDVEGSDESAGNGTFVLAKDNVGSGLAIQTIQRVADPSSFGHDVRGPTNGPMASNNGQTLTDEGSRPTSQDTAVVPVRAQLQPKSKVHAITEIDSKSMKRSPINVPGHASSEEVEGQNRQRGKRTYKSLSPYGVLF